LSYQVLDDKKEYFICLLGNLFLKKEEKKDFNVKTRVWSIFYVVLFVIDKEITIKNKSKC
jgi:hypothetical protein